ncbi:MAG: hypothetical protein ACP5D2_05210, partial [Candidatus Nanoarchaeia archaeon]
MATEIVIYVIAALLGVFGIGALSVKSGDKIAKYIPRNLAVLIGIGGAIFLLLMQFGALTGIGMEPLSSGVPSAQRTERVERTVIDGGPNYQPTATYATKDKFSTTEVSGTSYYKRQGKPASTSALTNVNEGERYTYWMENSSYYVKPEIFTAESGANNIVADAWQNGTVSITGYDTVNRESIADGAYNTSLGANDQANIEFTYQGQSKHSAGPFGGVMVLEYNSTISSVSCSGDQVMKDSPYHVTY